MIYISSSSLKSLSIEHCLTQLIKVDIRNIELSGGAKYCADILTILKSYKKKHSLNFLIHNYFPPPQKDFVLNIASNNEITRTKGLDFIKTSIKFAHNLGIDCYTLHAGYTRELCPASNSDYFTTYSPQGISPELALTHMFESLSEIREYAVERGVRIGLENLFPTDDAPESSLLCAPDDIFHFLDNFSEDSNVGFLLDLGHLLISANFFGFDKDEFIESLSKEYHHKILEIHLSGNDGKKDQHTLLSPDSWQLKAVRSFNLKKIPVTIECRGLKIKDVLDQYHLVEGVLKRED